tara:strand:+ start:473 stop:811 length:339 start_codon:yes stop_codon:yes gene_type:complete
MQAVPEVPTMTGEEAVQIYVWIISILILVIIFLCGLVWRIVANYDGKIKLIDEANERANIALTTRLNSVIDDSIARMERKSLTEETAITRSSDLISKIKEILILARNENRSN